MNNVLIYVAIGVVLFVILREIVTWYWKINEIVYLLGQIEKNTRPLETEEEEVLPAESASETHPVGSVWRDGKWVDT